MAHECEYCFQQCYCDCEDIGGLPQPCGCSHLKSKTGCYEYRLELGEVEPIAEDIEADQ